MRKSSLVSILSGFSLLAFFIPKTAHAFIPAICDLCAMGVIAGLGVSRYFGIDDMVVGVWIGGIIVTMITLTLRLLEKRKWTFPFQGIVVTVLFFASMFGTFYYTHIIGIYKNTLFDSHVIYLDKIVVSSIVGAVFFTAASFCYERLKAKNGGKAYFPFQKVVMPVGTLILLSFLFYFLTTFKYV